METLPVASGTSLLIPILVLFVIIYIWMGIKFVPQTKNYLINRLGKYHRTLQAGPHWIWPILERVHAKPSILERPQPFPELSAFTGDNAEVYIESVCFWRMVAAEKSIYRITDIDNAVQQAALGAIRAAVGNMSVDDILAKRDEIKVNIKTALLDATSDWGIDITRVEITNIDFPSAVKASMEKQVAAEREKRETILRAEANKRDVELRADADLYDQQKKADAELYAAQKEADGKRVTAEAQAFAVEKVATAISNNGETAVQFEIAKGQIDAMTNLGKSPNAKLVVLPTDVTETFGGLSAVMEVLKGSK